MDAARLAESYLLQIVALLPHQEFQAIRLAPRASSVRPALDSQPLRVAEVQPAPQIDPSEGLFDRAKGYSKHTEDLLFRELQLLSGQRLFG
jgi:hypothetical protein